MVEQESKSQMPERDQELLVLCHVSGPIPVPAELAEGSEGPEAGGQESCRVDSRHAEEKVVWGTVLHSCFLK